MADRLRVNGVGRSGFTYPVGADVALVRAAGGLSNLSTEDQAAVAGRMKSVNVGDFCDDMPEESAALCLSRGWIERVSEAIPADVTTEGFGDAVSFSAGRESESD